MSWNIDFTEQYQPFSFGFCPHPPYRESSSRVWMPCASPTITSVTLTASRVYYFLFPFYRGFSGGEATPVLYVSTGAASSVTRAGLYSVVNGLPGSRIHDFGTADTSTSSTEVSYSYTTNIESGYYFGAIISNGTPAIRAGGSPAWFHYHMGVNTGTNTASTGLYEAGSGSTLPATAGTVTWNEATTTPIFGMEM